jgi:hypothetical protein
MATVWSGSPSLASPVPASAMSDASKHWSPHGTVLTACVVSINLLAILLIFFFFWRFFSRKQSESGSTAGAEEDDDALPVASPWATRRHRRSKAPRPTPQLDVAASLPVYVYSGAAGEAADECPVCIVELKDGDAARQLPLCGHRFHADCVAAWLRVHATCPLCRASVVAPVPAAANTAAEAVNPKADAAVGADCPV